MRSKRKTFILKLAKDDEKKEMAFGLRFQRSLTTAQRFKMMFDMSDLIKEMLIKMVIENLLKSSKGRKVKFVIISIDA